MQLLSGHNYALQLQQQIESRLKQRLTLTSVSQTQHSYRRGVKGQPFEICAEMNEVHPAGPTQAQIVKTGLTRAGVDTNFAHVNMLSFG